MTFPIEFPEHPKVKPLSKAAKWDFVEMNAYSRRLGLDGVIPVATAHVTWSKKSLAELVASHPTRPLVELVGDNYVIRSYEDHQFTTADLDDLRDKRSKAGQAGGKASASARANAKQVLEQNEAKGQSKREQIEAESESGSGSLTTQVNNVSPVPQTADVDWTKVSSAVMEHCGRQCDMFMAIRVTGFITGKAKGHLLKPERYVLEAIRKNPFEIQKMIDEAAA
jgi:hypothetical protein